MKAPKSLNSRMAEYRRNFYNVYHTTLIPIFQEFELERKKQLSLLVAWLIVIITVLAVSVMSLFEGGNSAEIMMTLMPFIGVAGVVLLVWLPIHFNNKFVDKLKAECMQKILKVFGNIQWFDKTNLIADDELNESDLFSAYNRREAKDAFSGVYNGVKFRISETNLLYETGSGKNRRIIHVFNGVVIKFDSNKNILNKTIVTTKGDTMIKRNNYIGITMASLAAYALLDCLQGGFDIGMAIFWVVLIIIILIGYMCYKIFGKSREEVLNEVKLEDPEFSKKYKVYSSDQVEGRYLITTAFMERFKNLQTSFGTNKAKCSFYGNDLMFAITTRKNLFEIGNLFYSLNNPKQMEVFFEELTSIFMLVDYFKLDEKTGL